MTKYVEIKREKLQFCGNTPEEKKANELIYDLTLENDSLNQDKEKLIKYLEDKKEQSHKQEIICRERRVPKLYEIGICLGEQYAYQDILWC